MLPSYEAESLVKRHCQDLLHEAEQERLVASLREPVYDEALRYR